MIFKENELFKINGNPTVFKAIKRKNKLVFQEWLVNEKKWNDLTNLKTETKLWREIKDHNFFPLFTYEEKGISAKNIEHALDKFLDQSWGGKYHNYLKEHGLPLECTGAIDILEDESNDSYCLLKQKLDNDVIFKIEIWLTDKGDYTGLATEVLE